MKTSMTRSGIGTVLLALFLLPNVCVCQSAKTQGVGASPPAGVLFADSRQYFSTSSVRASRQLSLLQLPPNVWRDQKAIWTSPGRIRFSNLTWLLPLAATTGLLIATDHHEMSTIHSDAANRSRSALISDAGLAGFAGATMLSYGIGAITRNEHLRETGILATESVADSLLVTEAMKFMSNRQAPVTASGNGRFENASPLDSSFPSMHAALAWSAATVFAREYPGPVSQWAAYGLASLVSVSRVTAERHFPSDVLVGAAAGYLIGRFVYGRHHDDGMSDRTGAMPLSDTNSARIAPIRTESRRSSPERAGSPYVSLDSWIYPALKRLAALGYVKDQSSDVAPWTRAECLRQAEQAADAANRRAMAEGHVAQNKEALKLIADLIAELRPVNSTGSSVHLESLYTRFTEIDGTPLRDSYHFGQTIANDYGRPYNAGLNNVTGLSGYVNSGPFFGYFRGEYQEAPASGPDPLSVRQFIASADENPLQGPAAVAATNRFEPVEMYAGVKLGFENITFGKQSLWWGPGEASAFSFSTNAAPLYMLRFAQARPIILPGIFSKLGKIRTEAIFGKLSGHQWPARPYVNAQKISLDLTDNFELGFTRSAFFGGAGHPLTLGSLAASFVSTTSTGSDAYGDRADPGDRHSGFDFRYRVPGLRRYITVYSDSFADDEPSPIDNPKRSAWAPGLYLSQIPGLRGLDFRFETYSTLLYRQDEGGNFIYWNGVYHDSYTNNGNIIGSWIGRDSRAYVASTRYWFSAKSQLQAQYRQIKAGTAFLPHGGTQTDASLTAQWSVTAEWMITATAQYERYYIPIVGAPQRNLLGSLQVVFTPR